MNNMDLWDSVSKTNIRYTKPTKLNGMQITAIDPQYQKESATRAFGPFGIGWGIEKEKFDYSEFGDTRLAHYSAILWFKYEGERGEIPIHANIKVSYMTSGKNVYLKIDDNYAKKLQTDALTKGLSNLGFNADIFMGKFEDNRYLSDRTLEAQAEDFITGDIIERYLALIEQEDAAGLWFFEMELKRNTGFHESSMNLYMKCIDLLQSHFPDGRKTALKKMHAQLASDGPGVVISSIADAVALNDEIMIKEITEDLHPAEKTIIWNGLNAEQQHYLKQLKGE
jgi:hypothetical protein